MFSARREELLNVAIFRPRPIDCIQVVETLKYAGEEECNKHNWRQLNLLDGEVEDWLARRGQFEFPEASRSDAVLEGGIRLIFCERSYYRPPGFLMSQKSFLAIEKAFCLPKPTLHEAFLGNGMFSKHMEYHLESPTKIGLIVKVPQKMPVANYLLSLSHDINTGFTTALIFGSHIHTSLFMLNKLCLSGPLPLPHEPQYHNLAQTSVAQSTEIIDRLRSSPALWTNPMLLPTIILENYILRADLFAWNLDDQVVDLERQTGVVFAGRDVRIEERKIKSTDIPKQTIEKLTREMHTLHTQIIFYQRMVEWSVDCAKFLEGCANEFWSFTEYQIRRRESRRPFRELSENLEFLHTTARQMCGQQGGLKQRIQSQIDVLYSFIAQIDNSLNAKIAVSSARDSSAMKTLALITTLFLPGTYVATLFSMSMFNWSVSKSLNASGSNDKEEEGLVSNKFWLYWAVTIPLTLLVIIVWRVWWLYQERVNNKAVNEAMEKVGDELS